MSYEDVKRKIGNRATSTISTVLSGTTPSLQMEACLEDFSVEDAGGQFSTLYLSLRMPSVQKYLGINISTDPKVVQTPVPKTYIGSLANFAFWLFGSQEHPPLFTDSRYLDNFGRILENPEAVRYLENSKRPNFDYAFQLAVGTKQKLLV